jgi:polysaccharide export outer membrane protein
MSYKAALPILLLILSSVLPLRAQNISPVSSTTAATDPVSGPAAHPLQVSTGDLLDVNVFDTPEFSTRLRVDEHGMVTLPLGGVLSVAGLTAEQVGLAIETRFRETDILKDPHVSVTVLEYATQGVTILGDVKNPGVYPLLGGHGLLDLISAAGGLTMSAGRTVTITHRADPTHPVTVSLDTKPGNDAAFSVDICPGDTIVVSHAGTVYVLGDVGKPGGFLIANNSRLTVLQAIALAQGTTRTASLNNAKLIRKTGNGHEELPVPLKKILAEQVPDQVLADGDILFVPTSGAKSALVAVETILPAAAGAAIYRAP